MLGLEAVSRLLRAHGESMVFAMIGGTNAPWIAAGVRDKILTVIRTRHEATAVAAAMGRARLTGRPAVCSVSKGPGFSNALTAMVTAARGHVPVIILVAEAPSRHGANAQDLNQRELAELAGVGFIHVEHAAELSKRIDEAFAAAAWNGLPQVVSIAQAGVLDVEMTLDPADLAHDNKEPSRVTGTDPAEVSRVVDLLEATRSPLILAGHGAVLNGARLELEQLADTIGARLATTILATGYFQGHPADLGLCGGWATVDRRQALRGADVVVSFGASLNPNTMGGEGGYLFSAAKIVQCDVDAAAVGRFRTPDVSVLGDARAVAAAIVGEWERRNLDKRLSIPADQGSPLRDSILALVDAADGPLELEPRIVYAELNRRLPAQRTIVSDGGRSLPTLPSLITSHDHRGFVATNSFGSIGLGLGTAIGVAASASSDRHTYLICGDSGLMMTIGELDAVRMANLDLTILLLNDGQSGSEIRHLEKYDLPYDIVRQETPDLIALARAHGGDGCVVRTLDELRAVDLERRGLYFVDIRTSRNVETRVSVGQASERAAGLVP